MSFYESNKKLVEKFKDISENIKNAVEAVYHNKQFVLGYDTLTIFFDDDFCTPGETLKGIVKGHEA